MPDTGTDAVRWERRTAPELRALAAAGCAGRPPRRLDGTAWPPPAGVDGQHDRAMPAPWPPPTKATDVPAIAPPPAALDRPVGTSPALRRHHQPGLQHLPQRCCAAFCRSILADGFKRLLLVNSHGGNIDPLAVSGAGTLRSIRHPRWLAHHHLSHVSGPKVGKILDKGTPASNTRARPKPASGSSTARRCVRRKMAKTISPGGDTAGAPLRPLLVLCRARPRHRRDRRPPRRHGGKGRKAAGRRLLCPGGRHARQPAVARPRTQSWHPAVSGPP